MTLATVPTFAELGLRPELLRAVHDAGYLHPTPIQAQGIPVALRGDDLLGCAQTGTGKTAVFLLPILERLAQNKAVRPGVRALIITPTRELAVQIGESARVYGRHLPFRCLTVYGGVGMSPQTDGLRRGVEIVVATPGRLLDHMARGNVSFAQLEVLVLDEADRMLDLGFLPDVRRIIAALPARRQNLLFSATMPPAIEELIHRSMKAPVVVSVTPPATTVKAVSQLVHLIAGEEKRDALCRILAAGDMHRVLVFTRTKARADRVARHLSRTGRKVGAIHGDKSQGARTAVLEGFRSGRVDTLIATDIAARGLDVQGISHVVNFDLPYVAEDYVHRIGRTARAGASGSAISLVSHEETAQLRAIERLIGMAIPRQVLAGFSPGSAAPAAARPAGAPRFAHAHGSRPATAPRAVVPPNPRLRRRRARPGPALHAVGSAPRR